MYIEIHNHLGEPQRLPVTRVVVYQDDGTPLALAVSYAKIGEHEQTFASVAGQADFNGLLHNLGLRQTTLVTDLEQRLPGQIRF
jgi:hypothetical protein